ncbi:PTS sugar transporter subunit IIB [Neobacillus sp.]|jgi:cellobiose PTS system EIIB component|uniref:PTS sugar transporter subunit IIB n=1 Tax=Neobacillus sp. TaxID=2675273 RepID=UPI0004F754EC|nr:hypothetical protein HW35_11190 [Bacillus sp. X1(2014)]
MSKINIILVCSAGMSTSMIVSNMKKVVAQKNMDVYIEAIPSTEAENYMETNDVDVLLLGPQVRYLENRLKESTNDTGIRVDVINPQHYGTLNGEKILQQALDLIKEKIGE